MAGTGIKGTGTAEPRARLATADAEARLGLAAGSLLGASGVRSRAVAGHESSVDLAVAAGLAAMADAGIGPDGVDAVVCGSAVPYQPIPATAPLVLRGLGCGRIPALDVNMTCLGFVAATDYASALVAAGRARNVLVVSSETPSRALPWHDAPETAALFGDGAAAAVVGAEVGSALALRGISLETHHEGWELCQLASGGTRHDFRGDPAAFEAGTWFRMQGPALYRITFRRLRSFAAEALARVGWTMDDVDLVVPHQASRGGLDHLPRLLGVGRDRIVDVLADRGNQVAASLPTALDLARRDGRIGKGSKVLAIGTSAGVSFGAMALEAVR